MYSGLLRKPFFFLQSVFLSLPLAVSGAEQALPLGFASTEEDFLAEVPLVLTATRLRQPLSEAPVSMTVIDSEMIRASGLQNLAELLRLVPGFQVAQGNGNYFVPTYHGLVDDWPRRMQVQVDGRSVYLPVLSTVDWSYLGITLDDVERIEVIRGSNTPVYGSNAFLGVVNIITRQPFETRGWYARATVGALYAGRLRKALENSDGRALGEALDSREAVLRYASDLSGWDYQATFNYRTDDGFARVDDSRKVSAASFRAVRNLSASERLDLELGYSTGPAGTGVYDGDIDFFNKPRDKQTTVDFQSLQWTRAWSANNELSLRAYHNGYRQYDSYSLGRISSVFTDLGSPVTPSQVPAIMQGRPDQDFLYGEYDARAHRFDIELQHVMQLLPDTRLIWGAGARLDRLRSRWSLARDGYVEDKSQRLFFNVQWQALDALLLSVGTMAEHNQIIGTHQSPRFALNYLLDELRTVRFSATRSIRSPSLLEANVKRGVFFEDGSLATVLRTRAEDLREEELTSFEIGYIERLPRWYIEWDAKLFHEKITGAIFDSTDENYPQPRVMTGGQPIAYEGDSPFIYLNGVDSDVSGLELQFSFRPRHGSLLRANYAYAESRVVQLRKINLPPPDTEEYRRLDEGRYKAVPTHTLSLLASQRLGKGFELSGSFYRVSEMKWLGDGDTLPKYNRLDLRLAKNFTMDGNESHAALILQNLLKDYNEFNFHNVFGQRIYLQIALEL